MFAHHAVLTMGLDHDDRALGAITEALCGSGQHEFPRRLAPHHLPDYAAFSILTVRSGERAG